MDFETISVRDVDAYLWNPAYLVIDIRDRGAYEKRHLAGAVSIPYEMLEKKLAPDEKRELVLYCERGSLSLKAARELSEKGYRVKTMVGGIRAYHGPNLQGIESRKH